MLTELPSRLTEICVSLSKAVESIEFMTMVAMDKEEGFRYTRDQTMADKLMYIPNNDSQSYPLWS